MRIGCPERSDDDSGIALVEFALVLPVLLVLYLAGFQVSDVIACNRKVTATARAIADLVSQDSKTDKTTLDQTLSVATQVMAPYAAGQAMTRVSEIQTIDNAGTVKVIWSRAAGLNPSALTVGSTFKMPPAPNAWVTGVNMIFSEINYAYVPPVNFGFVQPMGLSQTVYMFPRKSDDIACSDC